MSWKLKKKLKFVTVITARKSSKRLPNKNILQFCGKPLIYWSILLAKKINLDNQIYVSSDCKKIKEICYNNNVNFIQRPKNLCGDVVMPDSALIHAYKKIKKNFDYLIFLQPTEPLRDFKDIEKSIELILKSNADSLLSVVKSNLFL